MLPFLLTNTEVMFWMFLLHGRHEEKMKPTPSAELRLPPPNWTTYLCVPPEHTFESVIMVRRPWKADFTKVRLSSLKVPACDASW
mmetsp:Transcript_23866/g.52716  ORF Transcript_23866/g.52716 Transcript_23866/m.52716 type:complete len:85 (-) Transcript_23866:601-855(-)